MANDELYTPKWIFQAINLDFDLDVCAPEQGPLNTPAEKWFSIKDDGLTQQWFHRVFMNPPFSKPSVWVDKWLDCHYRAIRVGGLNCGMVRVLS
jgi:hypothetical protein